MGMRKMSREKRKDWVLERETGWGGLVLGLGLEPLRDCPLMVVRFDVDCLILAGLVDLGVAFLAGVVFVGIDFETD